MIFTALAFASVACASTSGAAGESMTDLRGNARLAGTEPALLLVGPARLLHVNADRGVSLYRVLRREGTTADCRAVRKEALLDWDRESELLVRKDGDLRRGRRARLPRRDAVPREGLRFLARASRRG